MKNRRDKQIEQRRTAAYHNAIKKGATVEQAGKAADRAARGPRNAAITSAINS